MGMKILDLTVAVLFKLTAAFQQRAKLFAPPLDSGFGPREGEI